MCVSNSDPWSIVSLAYLLRYPNPYASHILSCDVISREVTSQGSLRTTRLILKTGSLPRWAPKGMISRAESWVLEESEVDPLGKVMRCTTKNLDHVKVMRVEEHIHIRQAEDGYVMPALAFHSARTGAAALTSCHSKTLQTTEAKFLSGIGWGLTKKIENYGLAKFKSNLQRVRLMRDDGLILNGADRVCSLARVSSLSLISYASPVCSP